MNHDARNILLIASSILIVASSIPYLIDIVKRKTKPRIISWFNWGLLGAIAGGAALAAGQIPAAVLSFASVGEVMFVVILGLYYGDRQFERIDILCQIGAAVGLMLWLVFDSPLTAIIAVTLIDLVAALPTYKHIWQKPHEETLLAFVICGFASLLTLLAITSPSPAGLVYPIYLLLANATMAALIIIRRKALVPSPAELRHPS